MITLDLANRSPDGRKIMDLYVFFSALSYMTALTPIQFNNVNGVQSTSVVGNIIEMYQASDHESHFQTIHRSRGSVGNDRSAFSPVSNLERFLKVVT